MDAPTEGSSASEALDHALAAPWIVPRSANRFGARFWRLCDALLTASARERRGAVGHGRVLLGLRTKRFDRPAAALNLVDAIVPGAAAAWCKLAMRRERLPVRTSELGILAFGTGDTVFRLGGPFEPFEGMVLKIERISLGLPPSDLVALARLRREALEDVLRQYGNVPEVFPEVRFLVVQSPLFGVPAVGALQPYVPGPFRDVMREVSEAELEELARRRPRLRAQIVGFFERTIAAWERGGWMIDLGLHNLVLAGEGDEARLVYLDVEMKATVDLRGTYQEPMYEDLVRRMRFVTEALSLSTPASDDYSYSA